MIAGTKSVDTQCNQNLSWVTRANTRIRNTMPERLLVLGHSPNTRPILKVIWRRPCSRAYQSFSHGFRCVIFRVACARKPGHWFTRPSGVLFFFSSFPRVNHLDEGQKKSHTLNIHMTSTCCKGQLLCRRQYARQGKWVMGFMGFKAREALGLPTGHSYPWLKRKRFRVFSRVSRL